VPSPLTRTAAILVIVFATVSLLLQLGPILQPFALALFFYYLSVPVAGFLERHRVPRFLAWGAVMAITVAVVMAAGWLVSSQTAQLMERLPAYRERLFELGQSADQWLGTRLPPRLAEVLRTRGIPTVFPWERAAGILRMMLGNIFGAAGTGVIVLFFVIFIHIEADLLPGRLRQSLGTVRAQRVLDIGRKINAEMIRFLYVRTLVSALVAGLSGATMLVFGLDLAVFWMILIFFGNFVPYIGSVVSVFLPLAVALLQYDHVSTVVVLAAILITWEIIGSHFIEPRFTSRKFNLSPLLLLLWTAFWGWAWGMLGLLLAVPILVIVKLILESFEKTRPAALLISGVAERDPQH
jgi:AI-2 transport protein TqsA